MEPSPGPGWYADPAGKPGWRWWDGSAWTNWASFGPKKGKAKTVIVVSAIVLVLALVTVFGLSGSTDADWVACNTDAKNIRVAIAAYHADDSVWLPAGAIDKTSVLLKGPTPLLRTAPSNKSRYSINTDGLGGVLVAIPPARSGGVQYDNGATNPCDLLK